MNDRERKGPEKPRREDFLLAAARQYYYKPLAAFFNAFLLRAYRTSGLRFTGPVLDAGCFEGSLGVLLTGALGVHPWIAGIDLNGEALKQAAPGARRLYRGLIHASATDLPFADRSFATVIFNASLFAVEPGLERALGEARRVLRPGGRICVTVPTDLYPRHYWLARFLSRTGLRAWARRYTRAMDRRLMHRRLFSAPGWRSILEDSGFAVRQCFGFFSPALTQYWSFLAWTPLRVVGAVKLVPWPGLHRALSRVLAGLFRRRYQGAERMMDPDNSTYIFIRAERTGEE